MKWLLLLLFPFTSYSATIWGEWHDTQDRPVRFGKITFTPISTPLASNTVTYLDFVKTAIITNGFFTNICVGGFYDCTFPANKTIRILVPTNAAEYNFNYVAQLATNVPVFVYPVGILANAYFTNSIWDLRNNQWAEFLGVNSYFRYYWLSDHLAATNRPFLSYEEHNNGFQIGNSTGRVFNLNLTDYTLTAPILNGALNGSHVTASTLNSNKLDADTLAWISHLGPVDRGVSTFTNGVRRIVTPYAYITNVFSLTYRTIDGTHSDIYVAFSSVFQGQSFDAKSGNSGDTNFFSWMIFNP